LATAAAARSRLSILLLGKDGSDSKHRVSPRCPEWKLLLLSPPSSFFSTNMSVTRAN